MMQRFGINTSAAICLVVILVTAVAILLQFPKLWNAAWGSTSDDQTPADTLARFVADHEEIHHQYQSRFDGRSVFHTPPPTPRQAAPRPRPVDPGPEPEPEPIDTGPPSAYQGPSLVAIVGDEAWFKPPRDGEKTLQIPVGEEKGGVEVVSIHSIFSAKVRYRDGEYDISLFGEWNQDAPFKDKSTPAKAVPGVIDVQPEESEVPLEEEKPSSDALVEETPLDASSTGSDEEKSESDDEEDDTSSRIAPRTSTTVPKDP